MLLQTHENWEIEDPYLKIIDPPGTRRYAMVEFALSVSMFIVEALAPSDSADAPHCWQEFLLSDFNDVRAMLKKNPFEQARVSILLPRWADSTFEYTISTILEAYDATTSGGTRGHVYYLADGRRYVDFFPQNPEEDAVTTQNLVLKCDRPVGDDYA